jgi:transposase
MKPYPFELRLKVLAALDRGSTRKEVARTFGVATSTLDRYLILRKRTGTGEIGPPRPTGRTPSISTIDERRALWRQLEENSDATLERHCELWEREHGERISVATMWRAVRKLGWTKKGARWGPPNEGKRADVLGESA